MVLRTVFPAHRTILCTPVVFVEKALRIRSGICVFHLVAEFKEYLVQCCTLSLFQHFQRFCCLLLSLKRVCFVLSVSLQAAHRTDGSVHGLLPSPFPDTAQWEDRRLIGRICHCCHCGLPSRSYLRKPPCCVGDTPVLSSHRCRTEPAH